VSVYLAKRYPNARIIAVEPVPENYTRLLRNLEKNNITNVLAINKAVTADGRDVEIAGNINNNSGGSSIYVDGVSRVVQSITLEEIAGDHDTIDLLKIDCEGAEYEILFTADLSNIQAIRGEVHYNEAFKRVGYTPDRLLQHLRQSVGDVHLSPCPIGETDKPVWVKGAPKVSVLMACYNALATIDKAIESVITQGVDYELIIVDDHSDDGTWKHLRKWRKHNRIKIVKSDVPGGPVGALNEAAKHIRGQYVVKLDSDDWFAPSALSRLAQALDDHPDVGFVYGACQYHGKRADLYKPPTFNPSDFWERNPAIGEVMYRAEAHEKGVKHRGTWQKDGRWFGTHDWDLLLQMIHNLNWAGLALPEVIVLHYNHREDSASSETKRRNGQVMKAFREQWSQLKAEVV